MFLILHKETNVVEGYGSNLDYMSNGYPRLVDINTAWPVEAVNVAEVGYIPEDMRVHKYCFTPENGFYTNPEWSEPNEYGITDELLRKIKDDAIAEVEEAVINADE